MAGRQEMMIIRSDPHGGSPEQALLSPYAHGYAAGPLGAPLPPGMPQQICEPSLFRAVLRHFWLVVLCGLIGAGAAMAFLNYAQPRYTAASKIYIEPTNPRVLTDTLGSAQRSNYLYTQAEVIKSGPILSIVAEKPHIKQLQTFELTGGNVTLYLRQRLQAEVGRKDDIISVAIDSPYPDDAARIVNAVVEAYTDYQSVEKRTAADDILESLRRTKAEADAKLQRTQAEMFEFTQKNPSMNFDQIYQRELGELSQRYIQAQLATIEARAAYNPGHPRLQAAQRTEEDLYIKYQQKLQQVVKANALTVDFSRLASDLATQKDFVKRLDDRIKELEVNKDAAQIFNNVQVLEQAITWQSFPRPRQTMAVAIVAGVLLGAGLALLRDRLDGRLRSVEEIQTIIGLPILGVVPAMSGRRTAVARAMTVHLDPRSTVAESYRTIRTAVYFGTNGTACKTLLITSPEPGDGKTTSASNLAIAIAQTGRSVLLLDADFRKPTQHKNLDIKDAVGLSSVLAGREPLERAIQRTGVEGLDILPCGPIPANPSEILNSREFGELIDTLATRYDHIIFDSPPVNAVTDARILGAVCDATILVLRADKSTRKAGEHARNALLSVGARLLGAIVNDAPRRKGYEVYGGGYYYGSNDLRPRQHDGRATYARPARNGNSGQPRVHLPKSTVEAGQ